MNKHYITVAAIVAALGVGPALAQNAPAMQNQGRAAGQNSTGAALNFISARDANTWRASELIGKDVYGANNEDIGEVGDVLLNRNGQVIGVVLDVGGFLGLGETNVAVPMQALQFRAGDTRPGNTQASNTGNTRSTTGATGSTGAGTAGTNAQNRTGQNMAGAMPDRDADRIFLIITKEQLQAAPRFEDEGSRNSGMGRDTNAAPRTGSTTTTR